MDFIKFEKININIKRRTSIIESCQKFEISLFIKPRQNGKIKRVVRFKIKIIIDPHIIRDVDVKIADLF